MKSESIYNLFYSVAAALLSSWIFIGIKQLHNWGGWLLMLFFLSIALAFRGSKTLKGLSYTMMIMAAVSIPIHHPQYFKTIGDHKLSAMIIPLLQIMMFGMGTVLSLKIPEEDIEEEKRNQKSKYKFHHHKYFILCQD